MLKEDLSKPQVPARDIQNPPFFLAKEIRDDLLPLLPFVRDMVMSVRKIVWGSLSGLHGVPLILLPFL
jgi:hypothetical protein